VESAFQKKAVANSSPAKWRPQYAAGDLPDRSMHAPHPDHIIDVFLESNDDEY
jgi:hypothetical protein